MLSGNKSAASSAPSPAPDKKPAGSGQSTIQKGKFSCTAQLRNTWESGGETYWQYEVTIRNDGKAKCSQWSVEIPFNGSFKLADHWNGKYTAQGKTLRIVSMSYNGSIPAGGSVGNIGFIVRGSTGLKLAK